MAKFDLLLLDTVIIIKLFELGIWDSVLDQCGVHLSQTIVDEANYYIASNGDKIEIKLTDYAARLTILTVDPSKIEALTKQFGPVLLDRLDPGEAELLGFLNASFENYSICSADGIVFRVLGALSRSAQGISLEELLTKIGLTRTLSRQYSKTARESQSQQGFREQLTGLTLPK